MLKEMIQSTTSVKELTFQPGGESVTFTVQVINTSDRFASFRVELLPAGAEASEDHRWYRLSPDISSKTPPGTTTEFQVTIFDSPSPGFVGQMNVAVRVFAMELSDETRQLVRLILLQGSKAVPLKVNLAIPKIQALPREEIVIPVRVINPGQVPADTIVELKGLPSAWFGHEVKQRIVIKPGREMEVKFTCTIPFGIEAPSQVYSLTVEAIATDGATGTGTGSLEVLPMGHGELQCRVKTAKMPNRMRRWFKRESSVRYDVHLNNASNLQQAITLSIPNNSLPAEAMTLDPNPIELSPQGEQTVTVTVSKKRPFLGKIRKFILPIQSEWSDERITIEHQELALNLTIYPIVSIWWIVLVTGIVAPPLLWWNSCLNPYNRSCGHQGSVTTVQLNGTGERAISGAVDQTLRQWDMAGFNTAWINQEIGIFGKTDKAARVMRYKPTQNDQVAVGLENGEVQIWDLLNHKKEPLLRLGQQRDDRVLDVRFTPDARSLLSAHGSGRIFRWDLSAQPAGIQDKPSQTLQLEFAIYSTSLLGDGNTLAIGGKFNRLELWNWQTQKRRSIPYFKSGGQYDYIQTLATSEYQPYLMASGDTQGTIALWDMKACTTDPTQPCRILDQWNEGHSGAPIQSVALSRNGCYLVSGGGDAQVKLWALTAEGRRSVTLRDGLKVDESFSKKEAIQSVDLKVIQDHITIISGSEDTQVRGTTVPKPKQLGCDRE